MFKKKKVEVKEENKYIIKNIDGVPVVDTANQEFLLDFDDKQKKFLTACLNQGADISMYAYWGLPYDFMMATKYVLIDKNHSLAHYIEKKEVISKELIWKYVHTDFDIDQYYWACMCLVGGIDVLEEVKDVTNVDAYHLACIAFGAFMGKNLCGIVNFGVSRAKIRSVLNEICDKFEDKKEFISPLEKINFQVLYYDVIKDEKFCITF